MNNIDREIVRKGFEIMRRSSLTICAIARDCNKNLSRNIPVLEKLRESFAASNVIIFENDSIDGTRQTLENWSSASDNVKTVFETYSESTIPPDSSEGPNKFYSFQRISKMVKYRNNYLDELKKMEKPVDFVIILDLDITHLKLEGIAHSLGLSDNWDVVCANGYSYSSSLARRYHDTYALVELGKEMNVQKEESIYQNLIVWSTLKQGMPLIPVYSAFGGLAIYRYDALKDSRYSIVYNDDRRVEVRCEHFTLCRDIRNAGYTRIFINPNMTLCNHELTLKVINNFIKRKRLSAKP
jgi:glycosyltransferase involved in cell wall biosynthesis